ncbi:hypothetical protein COB52_06040 [Candidatus Kaiserbacteria bacterium]|nr:MAG: hypothetical protein COB52_06040 [Candidatus Kaiserbacteria bacterium]
MDPLTIVDQRKFPEQSVSTNPDWKNLIKRHLLPIMQTGPAGTHASIRISEGGKLHLRTRSTARLVGNALSSSALEKHNRAMEALYFQLRTFVKDYLF